MDYNENSLITVSQSIFLRELVFKYPLIGLSEAVGLKANFQILKREVRKEYKNWSGLLGMSLDSLEDFYGKCIEKLDKRQ